MKRRSFLSAGVLALTGTSVSSGLMPGTAHAQQSGLRLRAGVYRRQFKGISSPTTMWGFDQSTPGPALRFKKGDRASIAVENTLPVATTVHWHGLRVPNAMDGVPNVTQAPIAPGETFRYQFELPDSGTFWYHPHQKSFEQVGRGLFGAFIVEEERPIEVDRDLVWVLGDFKIDTLTGEHAPFGAIGQHAKEGRLGNILTINGKTIGPDTTLNVRRGERLRLRLLNAATARVFELVFAGHEPWVVAFDGQGVTPHHPTNQIVLVGPGMRVDLVIDCLQESGSSFVVTEARSGKEVSSIAYSREESLRSSPLGASMEIQKNSHPNLNLKEATEHIIDFKGGDSGPPAIGTVDGKAISYHDMTTKYGLAWTVNSHAAHEEAHDHEPLMTLKRGTTHVISMTNATGFIHPIHLHGHFFRVISYNGTAPPYEEWRDTVYMNPWDEVQIAFVAHDTGDWMFHCHILEHAAAGMMGIIRVE